MEDKLETQSDKMPPVPAELPLLPLKDTVVYPMTVYPLVIGKEKSIKLINDVTVGDKILALTAQRKTEVEVSGTGDVYPVGTMARILPRNGRTAMWKKRSAARERDSLAFLPSCERDHPA